MNKNESTQTETQIDLEIDIRQLGERQIEALTAQLDHAVPDAQYIRSE